MLRNDENSSPRNWILARNFLTKIILTSNFTRGLQPIARRVDQALVHGLFAKTKVFMATYALAERSSNSVSTADLHTCGTKFSIGDP